jgi:pimeloyl-ACP methyl ester carboxylesterase
MYQARRTARPEIQTVRGLRYHLWRWGPPEQPPIVLLHGYLDTGETYQFLVDSLPDDWHLVAPDWRGFGRTEWHAGGYWFPDYLADLDALLEILSPNRPVRIVGHSMGGNVLALYGGTRPERVERIALLEGFGLPRKPSDDAPARYRQWLDELRGEPPQFASYASFDRFARFLATRSPRITLERAQFIARAWARESDGRAIIRSDPAHKLVYPVLYRRDEAEACWRGITAPVLILLGGRSEYLARLGPDGDPATLQQWFHKVDMQIIADCGHMLHHEQPQAVAAALVRFFGT